MSSSLYTPWTVTVGEQPTTAYWNLLGSNDASFNTGQGFNDSIIQWRHLGTDLIPTGTIYPFAGSSAPSSAWLLANGQAVSRTSFAALFAVCGTNYGVGDGSTTFNVPNAAGKVLAGLSSGDANFATLGQQGGEDSHQLSQGELPYYQLGVSDPGHAHGLVHEVAFTSGSNQRLTINGNGQAFSWGGSGNYGATVAGAGTGIAVYSNGNNQAHNNLQPYTVCNFIVKT